MHNGYDPQVRLNKALQLVRIREDSAWQRFYASTFGKDEGLMRFYMDIYLSVAAQRDRAEKRMQDFEEELAARDRRRFTKGA